jgi:hypothetical protein
MYASVFQVISFPQSQTYRILEFVVAFFGLSCIILTEGIILRDQGVTALIIKVGPRVSSPFSPGSVFFSLAELQNLSSSLTVLNGYIPVLKT